MGKSVRERTEELLQPILDEMSLELFDLQYVKQGPEWYLKIFVDKKEGGITIDECGLLSNELSEKLDEEDFIPGTYFLEVSSPGVERPISTKEDFKNSVGKQDRKSTRLNSSHVAISYAVFCLKKKKKKKKNKNVP